MSKAEKFIKDCTRNCSNEILSPYPQINNDVRKIGGELAKEFSPWLTPDQALRAVEIAREEVIEDLSDKAKVSSGLDVFYYGQGYKQAEKNLELTWEDMMAIDDLLDELLPPKRSSDELVLKGYYEEVLKRFKERSRTWHH